MYCREYDTALILKQFINELLKGKKAKKEKKMK